MDLSLKQHSTHQANHDTQENAQLHQDRVDHQEAISAKTINYRHQRQQANNSHHDDDCNPPHKSTAQSTVISTSKGEDKTVLPEKKVRFVADIDDQHNSSKRSLQNNHVKMAVEVGIQENLTSDIKDDSKSTDKATNTASTLCNGHNKHDLSTLSALPSSPLSNLSSSHPSIPLDHEAQDVNWLQQAHHNEMLQVTCHDQVSH